VQKTLEDANIKVDSVLSNLMGKSGRAMIEALISGETNPVKLLAIRGRRSPPSSMAARLGTTVEICWEADHPELLGLPFEATSLPDGPDPRSAAGRCDDAPAAWLVFSAAVEATAT
jgi:hypothetical protein